MVKTNSLAAKLQSDFPALAFVKGEDFYWSPTTKTIHMGPVITSRAKLTLLHEVAHALLNHHQFTRDIDLLRIEREAWDHVEKTLAPQYGLQIDTEVVEDMMDTYRDWLHARSTCPVCSLTGIQTDDALYHCLGCDQDWRVNDARRCGLKRYALNTK